MAMTATPDSVGLTGPILTADGKPLKASLQKSLRKNKLHAIFLVLPTFAFLLFTFIIPVISLMLNSVDDRAINKVLPQSFVEFENWDRQELPPESMYKAMFTDIVGATGLQIGRGSTRMNYAKSGWKSLMKKSRRKFNKIVKKEPDFAGPYMDSVQGNPEWWADNGDEVNERFKAWMAK